MKIRIITLFLLLVILGCNNNNPSDIEIIESDNTPKVSILGVFHFAGTSDYSSVTFDNLESEKRQKEIFEIIEKIEKFKPTKILVEYPFNKSKKLDSLYNSYVNNKYQLSINEIDQIGFRLAKKLNHKHIYAIDHTLSLPFNELIKFAEKYDEERLNNLLRSVKEQDKIESEYLAENTLLKYLIFRNSEKEDIRNKDQYLNQTAKFVNDSTYIGSEFVSKWWERNLMIMSNIDMVTKEEDRILVIIGAAHRALLKDFFEDRTDIEYVEIQKFLKD